MKLQPLMCLILVLLMPCAGCLTPDEYKDEADEVGYGIVARARTAAGQREDPDFTIEKNAERLRDTLIVSRSLDDEPGPRERLAREGAEVKIDLATALEIAARNSRDYQSEKERLFSSALSFSTAHRSFESRWFGTSSFDANARGDGDDGTDFSLAENGSLGFTRLLERGGALTLSIGENITRFLSNPASTLATTFASLTLTLPFLQGAGRRIAYESVNQAERNVVYAVRSFERFKREFAVDVTSQYMRLLRDYQTTQNEEDNYKRRLITAEENRARGEAGLLSRTDVERANNAELDAENRLLVAQQNLQNSLDGFKITLGLPTDVKLTIRPEDLAELRKQGVSENFVSQDFAMLKAIACRLDLAIAHGRAIDARRRVNIAKNALLAGLDVIIGADFNSNDFGESRFRLDPIGMADYSIGFDLDLPLDRVIERNNYRQSLIDYEAALRNYEAQEDGVKLAVRRGLRNQLQAAETFRIQLRQLEVSKTAVEAATLLRDAGRGNTLDLLDAQTGLLSAENAVASALINFKISRLEFLRDMGVLVVDSTGVNEEMTQAMLNMED